MFERQAESLFRLAHETLVFLEALDVAKAFDTVGQFGRQFAQGLYFTWTEVVELLGVDGDRLTVQSEGKGAH